MAVIQTGNYHWERVGQSLKDDNPELAARAFIKAGKVEQVYELVSKYQTKAEKIANNGCNPQELSEAVGMLEILETILKGG